MSLATQRAAIKTKLEAVSGIGKVQDHVIWTDDWNFIYANFCSGDLVHVWFIGLASSASPGQMPRNTRTRAYTWNLVGYYSLRTDRGSSKLFENIVDAILAKFDPLTSIGAAMTHPAPALVGIQNVVFGEIPCHTAQIQLTVTETTAATDPCHP
jgi:hypothetical protein